MTHNNYDDIASRFREFVDEMNAWEKAAAQERKAPCNVHAGADRYASLRRSLQVIIDKYCIVSDKTLVRVVLCAFASPPEYDNARLSIVQIDAIDDGKARLIVRDAKPRKAPIFEYLLECIGGVWLIASRSTISTSNVVEEDYV